jgi:hypothetical protein
MPVTLCRDCQWFHSDDSFQEPFGECHLHPPSLIPTHQNPIPNGTDWSFPIVDGSNPDPCSDAK